MPPLATLGSNLNIGGKDYGNLYTNAYKFLDSAGRAAISSAMLGGNAMATFSAKAAGGRVAQALITAPIAASAYGDQYYQARKNGASDYEAKKQAFVDAGIEWTTEVLGGFFGKEFNGVIGQMANEALEELTGDIMSTGYNILDSLGSGKKNELQQEYEQLVADGMSAKDAIKTMLARHATEEAITFVGTFLSMTPNVVGTHVVNKVSTANLGKAIQSGESEVTDLPTLVNVANALGEDTKAYKTLEKIVTSEKANSNTDIGQLYYDTIEDIQNTFDNAKDIKTLTNTMKKLSDAVESSNPQGMTNADELTVNISRLYSRAANRLITTADTDVAQTVKKTTAEAEDVNKAIKEEAKATKTKASSGNGGMRVAFKINAAGTQLVSVADSNSSDIVFNTADGREIPLSEIEQGTVNGKQAAIIAEAQGEVNLNSQRTMPLGINGTETFISAMDGMDFNTNTELNQASSVLKAAWLNGYGTNNTYAQFKEQHEDYFKRIDESAIKAMYEAGAEDSAIETKVKDAASKKDRSKAVKKTKKTQGKVTGNADEALKFFEEVVAGATNADITNAETDVDSNANAQHQAAQDLLTLFNDNAREDRGEAFALVHEQLERVRAYNPEGYKAIVHSMLEYAISKTSTTAVARAAANYRAEYLKGDKFTTMIDANQEMVNDFCAALICGNETAQREYARWLVKNNGQSFVKKVKDIIERIVKALNDFLKRENLNAIEREFAEADAESAKRLVNLITAQMDVANSRANKFAQELAEALPDSAAAQHETEIRDYFPADQAIADGADTYFNLKKLDIGLYQTYLDEQSMLDDSSKKAIIETLKKVKEVAEGINGQAFQDFVNWQGKKPTMIEDENGNLKYVDNWIVNNGEYVLNNDATTLCKKRMIFDRVLKELCDEFGTDFEKLKKEDFAVIKQIIRDAGYEVACDNCFVDSKRYRVLEWASSFTNTWNSLLDSLTDGTETFAAYESYLEGKEEVQPENSLHKLTKEQRQNLNFEKIDKILKARDERKKEHPKSSSTAIERYAQYIKDNALNGDGKMLVKLHAGQLTFSDALTRLRAENGKLFDVVNSHQGSAKPKASLSLQVYHNEVLQNEKFTPEDAFAVGGVRLQSFSDYIATMFVDYCQLIADYAAKGLPAHAYTKEIMFAKLFGLTGVKINLSLMPAIRQEDIDFINKYYVVEGKEKIDKETGEDKTNYTRKIKPEYLENYKIKEQERYDRQKKEFKENYKKNKKKGDPKVDVAWKAYVQENNILTGAAAMKVEKARIEARWNEIQQNAGLDADGNYIWAKETVGYAEAKNELEKSGVKNPTAEQITQKAFDMAIELQKTKGYSSNVGTILVGISDKHIRKALRDPNIRMVIPYHKSSINPAIAMLTGIIGNVDYTEQQNTRFTTKDGNLKKVTVDSDGYYKEIRDKNGNRVKAFDDYEWLAAHPKADARDAANAYIDHCEKYGLTPKFEQFVYKEDGVTREEGYYKVLEDFNSFDCVTEENARQQAVQMRLPTAENGDAFDFQELLEESLEEQQKVSNKLEKEISALVNKTSAAVKLTKELPTLPTDRKIDTSINVNTEYGKKYSKSVDIGSETDQEYMAAVESGDEAEAQRLVDEAAMEWGAALKNGKPLHLYHGTRFFGWTEYKDSHEIPFIYTSTSASGVASHYAGDQHYASVRKIGKPLRNGNSVEDIITNAETVLGTKTRVATNKDKQKLINARLNGDHSDMGLLDSASVKEISEKLNEYYRNSKIAPYHFYDEYGEEAMNKIANVADLFQTVVDYEDDLKDFYGLEEWLKEDIQASLQYATEQYFNNKEPFREWVYENRSRFTDDENKYLNYLMSYDVGDMAYDIAKIVDLMSDGTLLISDNGGIRKVEDVAKAIESIKNIASYDLYGNLGDKPFEFDANGQQFYAMYVEGVSNDENDFVSTDGVCKWALEHGYTSVVMHNIYDYGEKADNYVFFNSSQIKSADAVTYDNNGNVIPLSERFSDSKDIRYSRGVDIGIDESVQRETNQGQLEFGDFIDESNVNTGSNVNEEKEKWLSNRKSVDDELLEIIKKYKANGDWYDDWYRGLQRALKENQGQDYVERIMLKNKYAREEFSKFLSQFNDTESVWVAVRALQSVKWQSEYRGANRVIYNLGQKRVDEILAAKNKGRNVGLEERNYTVQEIHELFNTLNSMPDIAKLADKVFAKLEEYSDDIIIQGARSFQKKNGAYVSDAFGIHSGGVIQYKTVDFNNAKYSDQRKAGVLLHEAIHGLTSYAIAGYLKAPHLLSPEMREAAKIIVDSYRALRAKYDSDDYYGMTDPFEFVAELSKPDFREMLKKESVWERIKSAILRLFGVIDQDNKSAFTTTMDALEWLIENYDSYTHSLQKTGLRVKQYDSDTRYSRSVDIGDEDALIKENAELRKSLEYYKMMYKGNTGHIVSRNKIHDIALRLKRDWGSTIPTKELEAHIANMYDFISSGNATWDVVKERGVAAVEELLSHEKKELTPEAQEVLNYMKEFTFSLTDEQKAEVEYYFGSMRNWMSKIGKGMKYRKDGMNIDSVWQELSAQYPNTFEQDVNAQDMPIQLAEITQGLLETYTGTATDYYTPEELNTEILMDLWDSYFAIPEVVTPVDRAKRNLAKERLENKERLEKVKERYQKRYEALDNKFDKYKGRVKQQRENREASELKRRIRKQLNKILSMGANPTKDKHIPNGILSGVKALGEAILLDSDERYALATNKQDAKLREKLHAFRDGFEELETGEYTEYQMMSDAYNGLMKRQITELISKYGDLPIGNMPVDALRQINEMLKITLKTISNVNKLFNKQRNETISGYAASAKDALTKHKKDNAHNGLLSGFFYDNMKPVYFFDYLDNPALMELYQDLRDGEDTWITLFRETENFTKELRKRLGYNGWDFDKKQRFRTVNGAVELNLEELLAVYANTLGEHTNKNLLGGGFVYGTEKRKVSERIKGIKDSGISSLTKTRNDHNAHKVSLEDVQTMVNSLTDSQREYVRELIDFMSNRAAEWGNQISRELYGVELFKEKQYYPAVIASDYRKSQLTDTSVLPSRQLVNSGFTKAVIPNVKNPIVLNGFDNTVMEHIVNMISYNSFVLPLENFNRVYHYVTVSNDAEFSSVSADLKNAFGDKADAYINHLLEDINGGAMASTDYTNKLISLFKKNAVFASASVVVQQPSAIGRALSLIDAKYFLGNPTHSFKRSEYEEMKRYCPIAEIKELGYFDTGMALGAVDTLNRKEYDGAKERAIAFVTDGAYRDEAASFFAAKADEVTWTHIWNACKNEAKDKYANLSDEEQKQKAAEKFKDVITRTQVYDSVFSRAGVMRNKNTGMKMATSFMAEPLTNLNMLVNAAVQTKRGNMSKAHGARVVGSLMVASILNSLFQTLVTAARHDKDDDDWKELYLAELLPNFIDNLNPINQIPLIRDAINIFKGYDVTRADMSIVTDLKKAFDNLSKDIPVNQKITGMAGAIGAFFGLPIRNVTRDVYAVINIGKDIFDKYHYDSANTEEKFKEEMNNALGFELFTVGTKARYEKMFKLLKKGKSREAAQLLSEIKTLEAKKGKDETKVNSAIKTKFTEEYKSAFINGDANTRSQIINHMTQSGVYGNREDVQEYVRKYWKEDK